MLAVYVLIQFYKRNDFANHHAVKFLVTGGLGAPGGIYATANGFVALAMGSVIKLGQMLEMPALVTLSKSDSWFIQGVGQHAKKQS